MPVGYVTGNVRSNFAMNLAISYLKVLDSHNEIYRSLMVDLSPQQQSIVSFLANERCATTVKTVARKLFISHQTASSQLLPSRCKITEEKRVEIKQRNER